MGWLELLVGPEWSHLENVPDQKLGAALRGAGIRIYIEEGEVQLIGFAAL